METPVEIRYAGVVVARANEVRRMTVGGVDLFLAMPEPLPAGTVVSLGGDQHARIEKVIESADPSVAGVYVRLLSEGEVSQPWVPSFREDEVPAPRPPAVVVSPVIIKPVHAPAPPRASVQTPLEVRVEVPRPMPPSVVVPEREPIVETPLPVVVASVVVEEPARPFVAPLPQPNEKIASFDTSEPPPPPPAVVENAVKRDRKRATLVMGVAPPAERPPGSVESAVGEIDTGSRKAQSAPPPTPESGTGRPTIMVETDHYHEAPQEPPAATAPAEPTAPATDESLRPTTDLRIEDLEPARALPPARGRATKRRRTTQR